MSDCPYVGWVGHFFFVASARGACRKRHLLSSRSVTQEEIARCTGFVGAVFVAVGGFAIALFAEDDEVGVDHEWDVHEQQPEGGGGMQVPIMPTKKAKYMGLRERR